MNKNDYFEFEEEGTDFPFYRNHKLFSKREGIGLLISIILFAFLIFGPVRFYDRQEEIILFLAITIPLAICLKGNFNIFFKKPKKEDVLLVILCCIGCMFLQVIFALSIFALGFDSGANTVNSLDWLLLITQFIQIIAEELFKAIVFLLVLYLVYNYTNNRKTSIIISTILSLFMFGLFHANSYSLAYAIFAIGFGGFFELYPYLKTKNLLLSILVHIILNLFIMSAKVLL